jgi:hypothetical protein
LQQGNALCILFSFEQLHGLGKHIYTVQGTGRSFIAGLLPAEFSPSLAADVDFDADFATEASSAGEALLVAIARGAREAEPAGVLLRVIDLTGTFFGLEIGIASPSLPSGAIISSKGSMAEAEEP